MAQLFLKQLKCRRGQSTVEFALTLMLLLALLFFYFQLSMVLAFGNYVHYATFMAARAYLASGKDGLEQSGRAQSVIVRMLKRSEGQAGVDRFPSFGKGSGRGDIPGLEIDPPAQYDKNNKDFSWLQGVRYTFKSRLFLVPLGGSGNNASVNTLELTSESWLGREPAVNECQRDMGNQWFFDNGC